MGPVRRVGSRQPPGRLDAVEVRHADVHDDDIRSQSKERFDSLSAVGCLPYHLEIRLGIDDHPQAATDERLVVDQENTDCHRTTSEL